MNYRVWCKNKNEWEKDDTAMLKDGSLITLNNMHPLRRETHIVEFMADIKDVHGVYDGDILFYKGSNGEFGYFDNDDPDGIFVVKLEEGKFKAVCPWLLEEWDLDDFNFDRVIGNIHENKWLLEDGR